MKRFGSGGTPRFRFMEGRYGADELGRFLSISGCVTILLGLVLGRAVPILSKILILLALGLVICISTVFVKQHSVLDHMAALPVCLAGWLLCFHRKQT